MDMLTYSGHIKKRKYNFGDDEYIFMYNLFAVKIYKCVYTLSRQVTSNK